MIVFFTNRKPEVSAVSDKSQSDSFLNMFQQFGESLKLPNTQINDVVELHKKNIEAMQQIARSTSSGTQTLMAKQRENLEDTLGEITKMVQDATSSGNPSQAISDQLEFAKRSFEATIKNATEMGDIMRDTSTESLNILRKRVEDSMEEIRDKMDAKK